MGVNYGASTLYKLTGLSDVCVTAILRGMYEQARAAGNHSISQPTIDGDSNNICHIAARHSSNKSLTVGHFYTKWAKCGIKVVPVVDGDIRPTAKQATNSRYAKREKARVQGHVLLKEACAIKREISNGVYTQEQLDEKRALIGKKESAGRRKFAQSEEMVPMDFAVALEDILVNDLCVRKPDNTGGFVAPVLKAKFQADAAIIGRFINGETLMAITNDTDIPILAGGDFIALKEYMKYGNMTMVSTAKATIANLLKFVPDESKEHVQIVDAEFPVFEGVGCRRMRALMMVMLGCDVYGPGMKQIGASKLKLQLDQVKQEMVDSSSTIDDESFYNATLIHVATYTKLGVDVIDTLVKGILLEPTNAVSAEGEMGLSEIVTEADHEYFDGVGPDFIPEYLADMAGPETNVNDGPAVLLCQGVGIRKHLFLAKTGHNKCHECNKMVCSECSMDASTANDGVTKTKHKLCLGCYATEMLVPSKTGKEYYQRIDEMRKLLKDRYKFDDVHDLSFDEVEDAYDKAEQAHAIHQNHTIPYPIHPTNQLKQPTAWMHLFDVEFCKGGAFISDPTVRQHLAPLLQLLASCVTYEKKKHTDGVKDPAVYDALPSNIIKYAKGSRIDSGYRLLERCVRHGHDPKMPSMFDNTAQIIKLADGSIGMAIESRVPASMKDDIYTSTAVFTKDDLLCVECNCKSGSKGEDKVVCVHILPIVYKVTQLLYEDLAEHILIELAANYTSLTEDWSTETITSLKDSAIILMEAAGESVDQEEATSSQLEVLLEKFVTGTEKTKTWGKARASPPSEQGPITKLPISSPAQEAKELKVKNKKRRRENEDEMDSDNCEARESHTAFGFANETQAKPNYLRTKLMMTAAGVNDVKESKIGWKLLERRANVEMQSVTCDEVLNIRSQTATDWNKLRQEAKERSFRVAAQSIQNLSHPKTSLETTSYASTNQKRIRSECEMPKHAKTTSPVRKHGRPLPTTKPVPKKAKRKQHHSYCSRLGCNVTNLSHPNTKFHRIPAKPKPLSPKAKRNQFIIHAGKELLRKEVLDRCHFKRGVTGGNYRCCEEHEFDWVTKSVQLCWSGKTFTQSYDLYVPKGEGHKSTMCQETKQSSRGNANDRMMRRHLSELNNQISKRPNKAEVIVTPKRKSKQHTAERNAADALADAAETRKVIMQMAEEADSDETPIKINPLVAMEAGLSYDERYSPPIKTPSKTFFNSSPRSSLSSEIKNYTAAQPPMLTLGTPDDEIKRRTGFPSESSMLAYIILICGGDADLIRKRNSSLTWYEEWLFHFEWKYGRTLTRWTDASKMYGPIAVVLRNIVQQKLKLERRMHSLWPKFVSYGEDCSLRKPKWDVKYGESRGKKTRPIMWDMTGIRAYQFGGAKIQRDTYSKYYAGNCFKGGIFTQLCGWGGVHDLWGGNVSDSNYNERAGYLDEQWEFQKIDLIDGKVLPFTNIYDKGYRARAVCWRKGGQLVAQPIYAKSDQRFKGSDTLISASIAADRGGNERGVNISKRSGVIKRGFKTNMDPQMFQDIWITWAFQANFMYDPVL